MMWLTEWWSSRPPSQDLIEDVISVTSARHAVPHLHHRQLRAQAGLTVYLLHRLRNIIIIIIIIPHTVATQCDVDVQLEPFHSNLDPPCHWVWGHSESTVCWWCLCQWGTWTPHWGKYRTPGSRWASLETNIGTYSYPLPWWSPVNQTQHFTKFK